MPQHRKRKRERETHVMEDRATTAPHGGMQLGNNNSITYRNCVFTYNTTNIYKQCHPAEEHVVSEDTPRDLIPSSSVHTTTSVRLVDCKGRELELGDLVTDDKRILWSIYAGDGMIIRVNEETGKIVHEPINVEEPFYSFPLLGVTHSAMQIVQRAKGKIGQKYDYGVDFVIWCCTDMTWKEWLARN